MTDPLNRDRDSASSNHSLSLSLRNGSLNYNVKWNLFLSLRDMILSLNKRRSGLWQKRYEGSQSKGQTQNCNENREQRVGLGYHLALEKRFSKIESLNFYFWWFLLERFFLKENLSCIWTGLGQRWFYVI